MLPSRLSLSFAATLAIAAVMMPLPSRSQTLPACEPPRPDEYLLIVVNPTEEIERRLRNALPGNATATVCTYLTERVLRIDGFNTPEVAESWAQYASDASGLRTFVARPPATAAAAIAPTPVAPVTPPPVTPSPVTPSIAPPATATLSPAPSPPPAVVPPAAAFPQPTNLAAPPAPAPTPTPTPAATSIAPAAPVAAAPTTTPTTTPTITPTTTPNTSTYNPQPLGAGYAVLVDYVNRPEVAIELRQVLSRDVGLVAYGQRSYLLALQTPDLAAANQVLQTLTRQNFTALLVDSQSAILLTPVVAKLD